jgi:acetyltransferase-like isoleucine patch superfamily enzyme
VRAAALRVGDRARVGIHAMVAAPVGDGAVVAPYAVVEAAVPAGAAYPAQPRVGARRRPADSAS